MDTSAEVPATAFTTTTPGSGISQRRWIPVHSAIYCQEILYHIFSYCAHVPRKRERRLCGLETASAALNRRGGTLVRLACTCKAFSEPALDILWRRMKSLRPFLRILSDVEERETAPFRRMAFKLKGEVSDAAWDRFLKYTSLVREFYVHPYLGDNIADELMQDLLGRLGDRPLFPRLQVLQTLDVYPSGLDKKSALLYSGLRVLSLSMSHDITQRTSEVVPRVLETVYTTAPNLTTLILAAEEDQNIEAGLDTLAIIISFRGLRQLHFDGTFYLNYACLAQLVNLERLEHLSASLHLRDVPPSKTVCFPLVHDATLRGSSADLAAFFVHFAIPNLKTLTANATAHDLRVSLRSAIADLFDHVPRTLTTLCLEQDWMRVVDTSRLGVQTSTLLDILQPLLQFRLLHTVEIAFAYLPPIDDDGIKSMLEAWPDLTHLTIAPGPSFTIEGDRIPTTKSLVLAATKYPKLKELHLPLVDISDTAAMLVQNESFPGHPLKAISIRPKCDKSEHHRIFQSALLIDRLFPRLEFPLESASDYCPIWNALSKHLMCMSAGRKHARLMELFETGRVVSVCMCGTEPGIDKVPHIHVSDKTVSVTTPEN